MKTKLLLYMMLAFVANVKAQSPGWAWATSNGGTDYEWGQSVAEDAAGNTVVVGAFYSSTITFGSTVLTNPNPGKHTSYIVKYNASGNVTWAKQTIAVGGANYNRATGVGIDMLNNIYVTGIYFSTTLAFGTITITNNSCCFGAYYLARYDASGNIIWAITTSGVKAGGWAYPPQPNYEPVPINKMAINKNNGDLYIVGTFDSLNMTFGSTVLTNLTLDTGYLPQNDIFIAKYNSAGNFIWAKSIGGQRQDYATDIAVNNSNVFVTGAFSSSLLFVGSTILINPNQNGSWDNHEPFVAKYDTAGNLVWAKQGRATLTGIKRDRGKNLAADASGNCYLTGEFESPFIVFDSDTLFNTDTVSGSSKIFVVKYNSSGNVIWTKNFANGIGNDFVQGIQTDGNGNVYVGGTSYGNAMTFDSITLNTNGYGIYIAKFNPSGNVYWAKSPGGNYQQKHLVGLSVNAAGNVYITGGFKGSMYFGNDTLTSNGQSDIFLAKLSAVVGIDEYFFDNDIQLLLSPNPSNGEFNVSSFQIPIQNIDVYNLFGEKVYSETTSQTSIKKINLKNNSSGIYFVKVFDGEKSYCKKLIIERD